MKEVAVAWPKLGILYMVAQNGVICEQLLDRLNFELKRKDKDMEDLRETLLNGKLPKIPSDIIDDIQINII